jgi:DNA-binding winged helix-turn-helix (wHTH) protein
VIFLTEECCNFAGMQEKPFVLNNRFHVDPSRKVVADTILQKETRLENRLMNLLLLLCSHGGKLVSREQITKEIWDDYGNADESLTQAVSYLRKVLADDQKKMIQTIPKKGYILYAELGSLDETVAEQKTKIFNLRRKYIWLIGIAALSFLIVYIIFRPSQEASGRNPDLLPVEKAEKATDTVSHNKGADIIR